MGQLANVAYGDMHCMHGFCDGNARDALWKYQCLYPSSEAIHNFAMVLSQKTGTFRPLMHTYHGRHNVHNEDK
jgi:hypothetical protein